MNISNAISWTIIYGIIVCLTALLFVIVGSAIYSNNLSKHRATLFMEVCQENYTFYECTYRWNTID